MTRPFLATVKLLLPPTAKLPDWSTIATVSPYVAEAGSVRVNAPPDVSTKYPLPEVAVVLALILVQLKPEVSQT